MTVLHDVNTETQAQLIARLTAENEALKAQASSKLRLTVGQAGTVCLYHGARYPVSLYREQWERILPFLKSGEVERFIQANTSKLSVKA